MIGEDDLLQSAFGGTGGYIAAKLFTSGVYIAKALFTIPSDTTKQKHNLRWLMASDFSTCSLKSFHRHP